MCVKTSYLLVLMLQSWTNCYKTHPYRNPLKNFAQKYEVIIYILHSVQFLFSIKSSYCFFCASSKYKIYWLVRRLHGHWPLEHLAFWLLRQLNNHVCVCLWELRLSHSAQWKFIDSHDQIIWILISKAALHIGLHHTSWWGWSSKTEPSSSPLINMLKLGS